MSNVPNELTKKFAQHKYPISTGSEEWRDIKGDFEIEDDAIMGSVAHQDYDKPFSKEKIEVFKSDLVKFKARVDNYNPRDEVEIEEKQILQNKVENGLEIYKIILSGQNERPE